MANLINETINTKEAILFMCGGVNEISQQFAEMHSYCRKKHLHIADFFFETSNISSHQKECYKELLNFIRHTNVRTAVVFYDNESFHKYANTNDFLRFTASKKIELHLAKDRIILSNPR